MPRHPRLDADHSRYWRKHFTEPDDVFFLFAYKWVVDLRHSPLSLCRFIKPRPYLTKRETMRRWINEVDNLRVLTEYYNRRIAKISNAARYSQ